MAIFELIQPVLKNNADADKVRALLKTHIGEYPGVQSLQPVKAVGAAGSEAGKQGGTHFVLVWDHQASIEKAQSSPNLAALKEHTAPFVVAPVVPQFFQPIPSPNSWINADETIKSIMRDSTRIHLIKVSVPNGEWDKVKTAWVAFTRTLQGLDGLTGFFAGEGIITTEGVFLGVTGWNVQSSLDEAFAKSEVGAKLGEFEEAAGANTSSTFIFSL